MYCRGVSKLSLTFDPVRLKGFHFCILVFSFHISLISKKNTNKKVSIEKYIKKKGGIHGKIHFIGIL